MPIRPNETSGGSGGYLGKLTGNEDVSSQVSITYLCLPDIYLPAGALEAVATGMTAPPCKQTLLQRIKDFYWQDLNL